MDARGTRRISRGCLIALLFCSVVQAQEASAPLPKFKIDRETAFSYLDRSDRTWTVYWLPRASEGHELLGPGAWLIVRDGEKEPLVPTLIVRRKRNLRASWNALCVLMDETPDGK